MIEINEFDKIIAANWKLNCSLDFLKHYFNKINSNDIKPGVCGIISPPLVYIQNCSLHLKSSSLFLGAQDCSLYNKGAYTGENSASMLKDNNCQFCIVGHSERRQIFGETSKDVKKKAENLINQGINPIICVGETLAEKNAGSTKNILYEQLSNSLPEKSSSNSIIIAYEPIWAIGSGLVPSLEEINDIHSYIKSDINKFKNYKILYGGSVKSSNVKEILNLENVDGVLVGGASLDPIEFTKILNAC
jgi:triosephosphate isomerase